MCILCVVQRWSRGVATMLPWLVLPLIFLWMLSQLLPQNLRFEVTSPRVACVGVLVITLLWYEILMPKLSMWRARRSARIREQRRTHAIELQKLKKLATRRCRNCLTPYRDQNPGGGKFMCSYCGHISKRPVLDLAGWQDWPGESISMSRYWINERCLPEKSCWRVSVFGCRLMASLVLSVRWILRKVFRVGSRVDDSLDGESNEVLNKRGENGGSFHESRVEKSRRKAEEKRHARLEREMLEEEERKQREEVARLVEERRKLRDEKIEAEKLRSKGNLSVDGERESRKETERRRRERRREKDKGSTKSNSDGEELEKRANRESEKKRELDKKSEIERQKAMVENFKSQALEGNKVAASKTRYFDRMKGTFLSSRGFNGSSLFGRNAQTAVTINKVSKPDVGFVDHGQNSGIKKDVHSAGNVTEKFTASGDHRPAGAYVQPWTNVPKKSWHHLFSRSSAVSPDPDTSNIMFGNLNCPLEAKIANDHTVLFRNYSVDNQFNFGQSLPHAGYSSPNGSLNGDLVFNAVVDSVFPPIKEPTHSPVIEDAELFEDPCYVPDSSSLIPPVPYHLDKFRLDLGTGFIDNSNVEVPRVLKNVTATAEVSKPSPIESPLSRLRGFEERQVSCTPRIQKNASESDESSYAQGSGTWQMWGTPLAQEGLGLAGGPSNWFSPLIQSKCNQEDATHPLGHSPVISHIVKGSPVPSIITPQKASVGNLQNVGTFSPLVPGLNDNDPWLQNSSFQSPLPVDAGSHFLSLDFIDNIAENEATYGTPKSSALHPLEANLANGWSTEEWETRGMKETVNSTAPANHIGLFSTGPDVQSVWSYNHQ